LNRERALKCEGNVLTLIAKETQLPLTEYTNVPIVLQEQIKRAKNCIIFFFIARRRFLSTSTIVVHIDEKKLHNRLAKAKDLRRGDSQGRTPPPRRMPLILGWDRKTAF